VASPRERHFESAQVARQCLDAHRIAHSVQYGQSDNALFIINGHETPVLTTSLDPETGVLRIPTSRRTKLDYEQQLLVDPDARVVELHARAEHTFRVMNETLQQEVESYTRLVWVVLRQLQF
jgi:hypothetical protein